MTAPKLPRVELIGLWGVECFVTGLPHFDAPRCLDPEVRKAGDLTETSKQLKLSLILFFSL